MGTAVPVHKKSNVTRNATFSHLKQEPYTFRGDPKNPGTTPVAGAPTEEKDHPKNRPELKVGHYNKHAGSDNRKKGAWAT
jgi:hypothetical protein